MVPLALGPQSTQIQPGGCKADPLPPGRDRRRHTRSVAVITTWNLTQDAARDTLRRVGWSRRYLHQAREVQYMPRILPRKSALATQCPMQLSHNGLPLRARREFSRGIDKQSRNRHALIRCGLDSWARTRGTGMELPTAHLK